MKTAALFPGQGAQYSGMGKWLYDSFSIAKELFEEASECLKFDVAKLCFQGSKEELSQTELTQPIVLTVGMAAFKVMQKEKGVSFSYGAGHSLGEYTALTAAGSLKFSDAVNLVHLRGRYMQEAVAQERGAMIVVNGLDIGEVEEVCKDLWKEQIVVEISNYNSPYQIVIAGEKNAIIKARERLEKKKATIVPLKVSAPFHCSLMKPAADKMKQALEQISFLPLEFPVISNVTGCPYFSEQHIKESLFVQMVRTVEWRKSMQFLYLNGVKTIVDFGPGQVVKNLMNRNYTGVQAFSIEEDWAKLSRIC